MSHLRRVIAVIILAVMGGLVMFGSVGTGYTVRSAAALRAPDTVPIVCC
jgi:hypothetical protein